MAVDFWQMTGLAFESYTYSAKLLAVNRERKRAGFELVLTTCFRLGRRVSRAFEPAGPRKWQRVSDRATASAESSPVVLQMEKTDPPRDPLGDLAQSL